jgi:hypothetical protein
MPNDLRPIAGDALKDMSKSIFKNYLESRVGLDSLSADLLTTGLAGALSGITIVLLKGDSENLDVREQREAEKVRLYIDRLAKLFKDGILKPYEIDATLQDNPILKDVLERLLRNVEQDRIERKLSYYVNLTGNIYTEGMRRFAADEGISFSNSLLQMVELDLNVIYILSKSSRELAKLYPNIELNEVLSMKSFLDLYVKLSSHEIEQYLGVSNYNDESRTFVLEGAVQASFNKLLALGYIDHTKMYHLANGERSGPHIKDEFRLTGLGKRFNELCFIEVSDHKKSQGAQNGEE